MYPLRIYSIYLYLFKVFLPTLSGTLESMELRLDANTVNCEQQVLEP